MPTEVELKFACDDAALAALAAHPRLASALETDETRLLSTYFDTQDRALARARLSCRIRSDGARRVQTVKADQGVASRHEWECETQADAPDLSRVPACRANAALRAPGIAESLAPCFVVDVERRIFIVAQGASVIEISLDRGWIAAGDKTTPICEAEFELKEGHLRDLFALSREIVRDVPLTLDLRSKAERGSRMVEEADALESDTPHPPLDADMTFADGFRALCLACLHPIATNAPVLVATRAPEALHQTRTAVRRLRAVLAIFKRHLRDATLPELREGLKWLSRRLGDARDLDVMSEAWAQDPRTAPLAQAIEDRRAAAYESVLGALDSQRYRLLLLDFLAWLACGPWTQRPPAKHTRGSFGDVWLLEAHRWDKRLRKSGALLADMDADERHALRIRAKSFHYVVDLTHALVAKSERRAHKAYRKRLKTFQSTLGLANDARVAQDFITELDLGPDARAAARRASRPKPRKKRDLLRKAEETYADFAEVPRPWDV